MIIYLSANGLISSAVSKRISQVNVVSGKRLDLNPLPLCLFVLIFSFARILKKAAATCATASFLSVRTYFLKDLMPLGALG